MTHTLSPEDTDPRLVVDRSLGETQDLTETAARALAALPGFRLADANPDTTAEIRLTEQPLLFEPTTAELRALQGPVNPDVPRPSLPPVPPAPKPSGGDGRPTPAGPGAPPQPQPQPQPGPPPPFAEKVLVREATPGYRGRHRLTLWGRLLRLVGAR